MACTPVGHNERATPARSVPAHAIHSLECQPEPTIGALSSMTCYAPRAHLFGADACGQLALKQTTLQAARGHSFQSVACCSTHCKSSIEQPSNVQARQVDQVGACYTSRRERSTTQRHSAPLPLLAVPKKARAPGRIPRCSSARTHDMAHELLWASHLPVAWGGQLADRTGTSR
jgi:hypothetical protein